jgi:hypothetical protein
MLRTPAPRDVRAAESPAIPAPTTGTSVVSTGTRPEGAGGRKKADAGAARIDRPCPGA